MFNFKWKSGSADRGAAGYAIVQCTSHGVRDLGCSVILGSITPHAAKGDDGEVRADMKKSANKKPRHKAKCNKPSRAGSSRARASSAMHHTAAPIGRAGRVAGRRPNRVVAGIGSGMSAARAALGWVQDAPRAYVHALPIAHEDREIFALLLAPFFILAVAIAGNQSLQFGKHLRALIAHPVPPATLPASSGASHRVVLHPKTTTDRTVSLAIRRPDSKARWIEAPAHETTALKRPEHIARPIKIAMAVRATMTGPTQFSARVLSAPSTVQTLATLRAPNRQAATQYHARTPTLAVLGLQGFPVLAAFDQQQGTSSRRVSLFERCTLASADAGIVRTGAAGPIAPPTWIAPGDRSSFGQRLAAAARRQVDDFVVYDAAYRAIAYPRGDVPALYGVCTDVVIRAYRHLGIDLQVAVHKARVGSGDRNIDHRRTETLRRFFQRVGQSLPITNFAEDYMAGDIVTYARPQNTGTASRSHIAMVSDIIAPSGRPMIIHNRGWGPQLEDALFVDRITGHYRYAPAPADSPVGEGPPPEEGPHRLFRRAAAAPYASGRHTKGISTPTGEHTLR